MEKKDKTLRETFALAYQDYKNKNYKSAELLCKKILSIDSNHFDSIFLFANLSARQQNFEESKKLLLKAIEIQPNHVGAYNNLGNTHQALGEFEEAKNCYQKTIRIDSNNTNAHYNLGLVFYKLNKLFFSETTSFYICLSLLLTPAFIVISHNALYDALFIFIYLTYS